MQRVDADRRRGRPRTSSTGTKSSRRYVGATPSTHFHAITADLKVTRRRTGSQWRLRSMGVDPMWFGNGNERGHVGMGEMGIDNLRNSLMLEFSAFKLLRRHFYWFNMVQLKKSFSLYTRTINWKCSTVVFYDSTVLLSSCGQKASNYAVSSVIQTTMPYVRLNYFFAV